MEYKINEFIIFCIEEYKEEHNIKGREAYEIFEKYAIFDYLENVYDGLHTQGSPYILKEIEETIKARKKEKN